jgi:hypothetical protein
MSLKRLSASAVLHCCPGYLPLNLTRLNWDKLDLVVLDCRGTYMRREQSGLTAEPVSSMLLVLGDKGLGLRPWQLIHALTPGMT